jgi:hypothetical protein
MYLLRDQVSVDKSDQVHGGVCHRRVARDLAYPTVDDLFAVDARTLLCSSGFVVVPQALRLVSEAHHTDTIAVFPTALGCLSLCPHCREWLCLRTRVGFLSRNAISYAVHGRDYSFRKEVFRRYRRSLARWIIDGPDVRHSSDSIPIIAASHWLTFACIHRCAVVFDTQQSCNTTAGAIRGAVLHVSVV